MVCVCVCVDTPDFKKHASLLSVPWRVQGDGFMLTPHCWWRSCATWFWGTCHSPSLSGTGRTPCADSGGKKGGAPTQDSPANPWGCGLVRDRSPHRSCRGWERKLGSHVILNKGVSDVRNPTHVMKSILNASSLLESKMKRAGCDRCYSVDPCSLPLDWLTATGLAWNLNSTDMSYFRDVTFKWATISRSLSARSF